jgi:PAS domain S-box-containing protein
MTNIFNPEVSSFDLTSILPTLVGVLVFTREHGSRLGRRYFLFSLSVAVAIDFLPAMGIETVIVGYIPIAIFVFVMGYAIIRYRLVDLTPELAASTILHTMPGGAIVTDRTGVIRIANEAAETVLEIGRRRLIDRPIMELAEHHDVLAACAPMPRSLRSIESHWQTQSGDSRTVNIQRSTLRDHFGVRLGVVSILLDITDQKIAERELRHIALHDTLTSLPSRKLFFDRFKEINDSYGRDAGDTVLRVPYGDHSVPIEVSAGYAVWPDDAVTAESIVSIADQRMYEQKRRS